MTRLLQGKPIPKQVLCPSNRSMNLHSRTATVYGVSVLPECLNRDCTQKGPLDALLLGPLDRWPNIAIICGPEGCGIHWTLIGSPPKETIWLHIEDDDTEASSRDLPRAQGAREEEE